MKITNNTNPEEVKVAMKNTLNDMCSTEKKELYEVRVFNEDDRKNNESCKLEQHRALLYINDVSEKYSNDMENNV